MDISKLLSPKETPESTPSPNSTPVVRPGGPPTSNPSSKERSPLSKTSQNVSQPTSMSPPPRPVASRPVASRPRALSGIDTLADLASMQHSQLGSRSTPQIIRTSDEKQPIPKAVRPSLESIARAHSGSRSSLDIHMDEAPAQAPESRVFQSKSLSKEDLSLVQQLTSHLAENPNAYESHLELIKILRHGFLVHIRSLGHDPVTYDLLPELRQAREAMASRFTMGEEAWVERIQDEMLLARTLEDCLGVVELCEKAVADEVGSTKLWLSFGQWELALHSVADPSNQTLSQLHNGLNDWIQLTENDKLVISEVFSRARILDVWKRAAEDTRYNINDSHLVWNTYKDLLQYEVESQSFQEGLVSLREQFINRLQIPHAMWEDTFQAFSSFVSKYDDQTYEETMVHTKQRARHALTLFSAREEYEIKLRRCIENRDKTAAWMVLNEYLDWEISQPRRKKGLGFTFDLANALYQRAVLLFPSDTNLWEDHLVLLGEESEHRTERISPLSLLGRACGHCPWSGKLWSLYIQAAERQNLDFADIGQIKHKATSTGLLDSTSMEDILTIHTAWCSFLRRRGFSPTATDEDADVAEVGIRSAIEDMESLGQQKQGKAYKGDPQYRLERIYIKFLAQMRKFDLARAVWEKLVPRQQDYYEFWLRWYTWEIHCWSYDLGRKNVSSMQLGPADATKVLLQAAKRAVHTDWPEKILDTYLVHCQDHEDVANLDHALVIWRRAMKDVTKRREAEAAEYAAQQQSHAVATVDDSAAHGITKRKREEGEDEEMKESKKSRGEEETEHSINESIPLSSKLKRDRENSSIIVKGLPSGTRENWVRGFFEDCGKIKSIVLTSEDGSDFKIATVEFESSDDVAAALTKNQRMFNDSIIEVSQGTNTTVYVTNFPPEASEAWIREKFEEYGDIISIRFPSLKYNTHRRFCYVQFKTASSAERACENLHETEVDGGLKLSALLSDPSNKQDRHGASYEGREVFVKNVDWNSKEDDLRRLFEKHGTIERVRLPKKRDGSSRGIAYIVFSTKEEAEASLILNQTKLLSRIMEVVIADPNVGQRTATTMLSKDQAASIGRPSASPVPNGDAGSPPDQTSAIGKDDRRNRTIALVNIPDTVNSARVETFLYQHGVSEGSIEEITLKPNHQGAIIVFSNEAEAGKADLKVSGKEIATGREIRVTSVNEMLKHAAESKDAHPGIKSKSKSGSFMPPAPARRPPVNVGRGGRRGGLGQRKDAGKGLGLGGTNEDPDTGKSNDEFRKMFVAGKGGDDK